jgi:SAM-dependent methyltransferase
MMNPKTLYSTKAKKYARYRWDYAPEAIRAIWETAGLSAASTVADIGAGTGILTRHFAGKVGLVFAIEPNAEMRQIAERSLFGKPACKVFDGSAEAVPLPDRSVDLITVAQAIHWFDPAPARGEFLRILKPGGWLALVRNYGMDEGLNRDIESLSTEANGVRSSPVQLPERKPVEFYYGRGGCRALAFPFFSTQDWEEFIGALLSASYMPDEDHPRYKNLETAARRVFNRHSTGGFLESRGETELIIGQPR